MTNYSKYENNEFVDCSSREFKTSKDKYCYSHNTRNLYFGQKYINTYDNISLKELAKIVKLLIFL